MGIGELIKQRRIELGMSQGELAKLAGVSRTTVWAAEAGKSGLSPISLMRIQRALGLIDEESTLAVEAQPLYPRLLKAISKLPPHLQRELMEYVEFRMWQEMRKGKEQRRG